jgi:putative ABC transport system substrate-binding protein
MQGAILVGLELLVGCGRLPGQAQPARVARLGFLSSGGREPLAAPLDAFRQELRERGYEDGRNIAIEWRLAEGRSELLPNLAAELVALPVDLIVVSAVPAALAARGTTSTIPIVMAIGSDPEGVGLIDSLGRPGSNVTGVSGMGQVLVAKRLDLLKEALPGLSRVAVLWNAANAAKVNEFREVQHAARALGLQLHSVELRGPDDLAGAFEALSALPIEALLVFWDPVTGIHRPEIAEFAARHGVPAMYGERMFVMAGGLMSYGPSLPAMFQRAAYYVDRILKGAKPADLPVEQPMTFDFAINLKTAQALGLAIPQHVLLQATEIIQ